MTIKPYTKIVHDDVFNDDEEYIGFLCQMNTRDVSDMEKEWDRYRNKKGITYSRSIYKYPTFRDFFNIYFQVQDGDCYTTPNMFVCTNYKVRDRLMRVLKQLEYHDTMKQSYCSVVDSDDILGIKGIMIQYGDY